MLSNKLLALSACALSACGEYSIRSGMFDKVDIPPISLGFSSIGHYKRMTCHDGVFTDSKGQKYQRNKKTGALEKVKK